MAQMKTPGVYIVEKDAFPNSVVQVATAVPAFIGYTEKARNGGKSLLNKPTRITSFADFISFFGGAPHATFAIKTALDTALAAVADDDENADAKKTAITNAKATADAKTALDKATIVSKSAAAAAAANPDDADLGTAADTAKSAVDDAKTAYTTAKETSDGTNKDLPWMPESDFSAKGTEYNLEQQGNGYNLYDNMRMFYQNGGGPCYIISVGDYTQDIEKAKLAAGIDLLIREQEPTMVVIPEAIELEREDCYSLQQAMLNHCGKMQSRVSILDVYNGYRRRDDPNGDEIANFRNGVASDFLAFGSAYYPWLNTTIVQGSEVSFLNLDGDSQATLQDILRLELGLPDAAADYTSEKSKEFIDAINSIPAKATAAVAAVDSDDPAVAEATTLNKTLLAISPAFNNLLTELRKKMNLLAPGAGMAGIYTRVDDTRGVHKAPANVAVSSAVAPAVNITHDDQEDLNVTLQGKSINAIRAFVGEGVLVWGARTLDGNSQDWRYVSVRRTMIMLEQSIKIAAKAYVFEPNDANTWASIKSMIDNFLVSQWKSGALVGAVPADAFSVQVGLGSTMTANDILDGIMRITVLVAISRPAEFIEITFQQQMQKS